MYLAILLLSCASFAAAEFGDNVLCKTTEPCQNGGVCKSFFFENFCSCPIGFSGTRCEIDPCGGDPCQNGGTCIRGFFTDAYVCLCPPGVSGTNCQVHPCKDSPCKNNGTCVPYFIFDQYTCFCKYGFWGDTCETLGTACVDRPCQNEGICIQRGADERVCRCPPNVTGSDCQYKPCASKPCGAGECRAMSDQRHLCRCLDGYIGTSCDSR